MATQGLVTVKSGDEVLMKVVAGSNGCNAKKLANRLKGVWPLDALKAYKLAQKVKFGSVDCLTVITTSEMVFGGEKVDDENLGPLYRTTFQQPEFNPRWENGTVEHMIVINV